jgi:hypothetical protein
LQKASVPKTLVRDADKGNGLKAFFGKSCDSADNFFRRKSSSRLDHSPNHVVNGGSIIRAMDRIFDK